MLINRPNLSAIEVNFRSLYDAARGRVTSQWDRIAMTVPSGARENVYAWLGTLPQIREWVGPRQIQNLTAADFRIKNRAFEGTVGVDRHDIDDDLLGIYKPQIEMLGELTATFPDKLMFRLLLDGFATKCYDGQNFFDTDHPVIDRNGVPQSKSNFQGGAGTSWYLLDPSRAIRPFIWQEREKFNFVAMDRPDDEHVFTNKQFRYGVDGRGNAGYGLWQFAYGSKETLDTAAYADARAEMMSVTMNGGEPLGVMPKLLLVPPTLEQQALEVVKAERLANGATNVYQGSADVLVSPWLAAV